MKISSVDFHVHAIDDDRPELPQSSSFFGGNALISINKINYKAMEPMLVEVGQIYFPHLP